MRKFFFTNYLHPHKKSFFLILCLLLIDSAISLSIPYFIGQFAGVIIQGEDSIAVHVSSIMVVWLLALVLQGFTRYQSSFRSNMMGADILAQLNCGVFKHLQSLPIDYFNKRKKGEIVSLISNDTNIIAYFLSGILTGTIPSVVIALGAVLLMASINPPLAFIIAVSLPLFFIFIKVLGRKIKQLSEKITLQQASIVSIATENINTIKLVKSFNLEAAQNKKFQHSNYVMLALRRTQFKIQAIIAPLIQLLVAAGIVVLVFVSARYYQSGELSIAELVTLLAYGFLFSKPIANIAAMYGQVQQALGASSRIIEVFKAAPENISGHQNQLAPTEGCVVFKDVSFSYTKTHPILSQLCAQFDANKVHLILGENGSGKTTICSLLMRFVEVSSGRILIDKQDISTCSLLSVRQHIGLVSQDSELIHGSIIDNITYGETATLAHAKRLAKVAGAHDFIEQLPQAYDTQIGDNGVLLSAGQRQRIALTRALMIKSKIIIFDEPTSFADSLAKQSFVNLLQHELRHHTVFVIAHDPALANVADNVYRLHDGKLFGVKKS